MTTPKMLFIIAASLVYGVAADDGDDFSNNLFTDLGPLLSLFGERVTMQFMSQSIGWEDNIILAMVPLGIITAIVGAIRVGGPTWLKAIIGRARESRAISEAELMSSTSHEVCELWNGQEIVRVMGKGPIREFIILSLAKDENNEEQDPIPPSQLNPTNPIPPVQSEPTDHGDGGQHIPNPVIMQLEDKRQTYLKKDDSRLFYLPQFSVLSTGFSKLRNRFPRRNNTRPLHNDPERGNAQNSDILSKSDAPRDSNTPPVNNAPPNSSDLPTGSNISPDRNGGENSDRLIIIIRNTNVSAPNLTLNVRSRLNKWEPRGVAIFGIILQFGVLGYFGFASLRLPKDGDRVADYALPCTLVGTLLLVFGMMICSHVVETSTKETTYRPVQERAARVVWLQRSGTVNDQAFDSFAIFPTHPLNLITTSERADSKSKNNITPKTADSKSKNCTKLETADSKSRDKKHEYLKFIGAKTYGEAVAIFGALVCICGYVVQFVGLRGTHWSAAVVQLGATVVMTAVRAWVRRNLAQLPKSQHILSGFELDWLALTLSMKPEMAPWSIKLSDEQADQTRLWTEEKKWDWEISRFQDKADGLMLKPFSSGTGTDISNRLTEEKEATVPGNQANNIMRMRRELGRLANWRGPASTEAIGLARAIEITMDTLFNHSSEDLSWSWSLPVRGELIHFRLVRSAGSWKSFADELEAALSLWLYYINDSEGNKQRQRADDENNGTSKADSAMDDDAWLRVQGTVDKRNLRLLDLDSPRLRRDLDWWMPDGAARVLGVKTLKSNEGRGTIEAEVVGIEEQESSIPRTIDIEEHRMVGLTADSIALESDGKFKFPVSEQDGPRDERTILAVDSYGSLRILAVQYIFSTFMWAAVNKLNELKALNRKELDELEKLKTLKLKEYKDKLKEKGFKIEEFNEKVLSKKELDKTGFRGVELRPKEMDEGQGSAWRSFSLHNAELSNMAQSIHSTGIGSIEEVYLSIIPPLSKWNQFPRLDAVVHLVQKHAQSLEKSGRWEEAGNAYLWLFEISRDSNIATNATALLVEYLRVVNAALELRKDQNTPYYAQTKLSERIFRRLENDKLENPTVYDKLASLYETQNRHWDSGLQQGTPERLVSPDSTLYFTNLHLVISNMNLIKEFWKEIEEASQDDVCNADIFGWTPLHYGICNHILFYIQPIIESLISQGANVNAQDIRGLTPLHIACQRWNAPRSTVEELLDHGADVNILDIDGRSPLHYAAEHGLRDAVQYMIQAGANVNLIDCLGFTPLFWAAYKGHKDLVNDLWSAQHEKLCDHNGRTPLHLAAIGKATPELERAEQEKARLETIKNLIGKAVDIEATDRSFDTVLDTTIKSKNKGVAKALLENGPSMKTGTGWTSLHGAALENAKGIAKLLLKYGADVNAKKLNKQSPLHVAADRGNVAVAKLLLSWGADKEAKDCLGCTPLAQAAIKGHLTIVQLLLNAGADKEAKNDLSQTPLHTAAEEGYRAIVQLLLDAVANMEAKDDLGQTPLHMAASEGNEEIVCLLLNAGADKEARDCYGKTPREYAEKGGYEDVERLLRA